MTLLDKNLASCKEVPYNVEEFVCNRGFIEYMAFLEVSNISKKIEKKQVLKDLSLEAEKGEIIAIRGGNGAGKSTFIKILASILHADGGRLSLDGITNPFSAPWRKKVAWVPQDLALDEKLSVKDNLKFWAAVSHYGQADLTKFLQQAYVDPLISGFLEEKVSDLSGGMKRRANLVSSIFLPAELVLLDEPFVGADADSQILMQEKVVSLAENGALVIFVSHELGHIQELASRILDLENGRFV